MSKARALLAIAFVLVFAAGVLVGMARQPLAHADPAKAQDHRPWIAKALNLTPAQDEQMKSIWSGVVKLRHDTFEQRRKLDQDRQDAVLSLLNGEQHLLYDQIHQEYVQHLDELDKQMQQAVNEANEKTRHILTPQQLDKFEKMQRDHELHRPRHPHGEPATAPGT